MKQASKTCGIKGRSVAAASTLVFSFKEFMFFFFKNLKEAASNCLKKSLVLFCDVLFPYFTNGWTSRDEFFEIATKSFFATTYYRH